MRSAAIREFSHLDTDEIIVAQKNIVVRIEAAVAVDRCKLLYGRLYQCKNAPVEVLRGRTQRAATPKLWIGNADAVPSVRNSLRHDLQSLVEAEVLLFKSHQSFASSIRPRPGALPVG